MTDAERELVVAARDDAAALFRRSDFAVAKRIVETLTEALTLESPAGEQR